RHDLRMKERNKHMVQQQVEMPRQSTGHPAYEKWMESQGLPVYRGHFIANPMELKLAWWAARQCDAAFIELEGMQGVSEARITEIAPAATIAPLKMAI